MRMVDAAREILRRHAEGQPMHYRQITQLAQQAGLISPSGLTPEASMNAAITTDVARKIHAGEEPVFTAYGRGYYSLAKPKAASEVEEAVRRHNQDVRNRLHQELKEIHPRAFEELIGRLLQALGFEDVEVTNYVGDQGIDVRGRLAVGGVTNVRTAIQVKRTTHRIGAPAVQQLRGSLGAHERGLIITLGAFST